MAAARPPGVRTGLLIAGIGIALAAGMHLRPQALRVPWWVGDLAALSFVFTGWALIAQARGQKRLQAWLPVLLIACMTAIPVWIAFGPGPRRCDVGLASLFAFLVGKGSGLGCRIPFGIAALACMGILLLWARSAIRATRGDPPP